MRLYELETIKTTICHILELNTVALCLHTVSKGCVKLTFGLPDHVVVPFSVAHLEKLQKQGIKYMNGES